LGNKFWSGSDAFSAHHPLQAGFDFLSPDTEPSEMAMLASQIVATGECVALRLSGNSA